MRRIYKKTLTVLLVVFTSLSLFAQNNFFSKTVESSLSMGNAIREVRPERFNLVEASTQNLRNFLWSLPDEKDVMNRNLAPVMELPMPNGTMARFRVWHSSIQEAALQAKFPEIKTFAGQGIDDPYATIRMDYSPYLGFHAQILSVNGRIYIDPYARGNIQYYQSYYHSDNKRNNPFNCGTIADPAELPEGLGSKILAGPCRGTQLYTYRLAVACTGEYANAVGAAGNPSTLHARIVQTVNRVTGVYENEVAVRLILIANNNAIEFLDPATDPFTGNFNGGTLLNESQTVITNIIGSANFDIGHTFSTGGGGIAQLQSVCNTNSKARGITGSPVPFGDGFDIDYVAHEMGHQFGGTHTFNSTTGSCGGGNRSGGSAYEVGSGTTIMAYAGICNADNIQPNSDPFFHAMSYDQISNFIEAGGSCHGTISTGNTIPQITAMDNNNVTIPINTPFTLAATAVDGDNDPITYNWEEWDLGTAGNWSSGAFSSSAPLFKSRVPKTSGSRTFPDINVILAGFPPNPSGSMGGLKGETLPQVARTMKFKLTVRDNRAGGGGVTSGGDGCQTGFTPIFQINVAGASPFVVTSPNGGESYPGASAQNITWNVAGTNVAPFNTTNVKITLSTDGGLTYPTVVVASTPNDGAEVVTIPTVLTTTARIRIEALNNVYFDISDNNFSITTPINCTSPAVVTMNASSTTVCGLSAATFTAAGTSTTPVLYQWQSSANGTNWNSISDNGVYFGTTNSTLTITSAPDSLNGFQYRALLNTLACPIQIPTNVGMPAVLTVNPKPAVTVSASQTSITPGTPVKLTAAVTGATSVTYQWFLNGDPIPGATASSYNVQVPMLGDFTVKVTSDKGCETVSMPVKISARASNQLFIYPNPNNGRFFVAYFHSGASTTRNVSVFDAKGALVYKQDFTINQPYQLLEVNMMASAAGYYFVRIGDKDGKKIAAGKVLIGVH